MIYGTIIILVYIFGVFLFALFYYMLLMPILCIALLIFKLYFNTKIKYITREKELHI